LLWLACVQALAWALALSLGTSMTFTTFLGYKQPYDHKTSTTYHH